MKNVRKSLRPNVFTAVVATPGVRRELRTRGAPTEKGPLYRLRVNSQAAEVSFASIRQNVWGTRTLMAFGATEKSLGVRETSSPSRLIGSAGSVSIRTREVRQ
jgi:hypothetical protein